MQGSIKVKVRIIHSYFFKSENKVSTNMITFVNQRFLTSIQHNRNPQFGFWWRKKLYSVERPLLWYSKASRRPLGQAPFQLDGFAVPCSDLLLWDIFPVSPPDRKTQSSVQSSVQKGECTLRTREELTYIDRIPNSCLWLVCPHENKKSKSCKMSKSHCPEGSHWQWTFLVYNHLPSCKTMSL